MIYGFDCDDMEHAVDYATAALLVYAVYRSRNRQRFRVTPDMWGLVQRAVKSCAKRSPTIPAFLDCLQPKLQCETLHPRAMEVGLSGTIPLVETPDGAFIQLAQPEGQREFLTRVLSACDHKRVLDILYRETAYVVLLVRDRLERERPIEARFETVLDEIGADE